MPDSETPMTALAFNEDMLGIAEDEDPTTRHLQGDMLMCQVLTQLGYGDGVEVFEKMCKWYE